MNEYKTNIYTKRCRQYLTQDLSHEEKKSYLKYISGDKTSCDWIENTIDRRESILIADLKCIQNINGKLCNLPVNMQENGKCNCLNNHACYNVVLPHILPHCNY
jgi:hypothetical protein